MSFNFDIEHIYQKCICVRCFKTYQVYLDPFIEINWKNKNVTFELCENCIKTFFRCDICLSKYEEPWEKVYLNDLMDVSICENCFHKN